MALTLPAASRSEAVVEGISWREQVLSTTSVIISSDAVSGSCERF